MSCNLRCSVLRAATHQAFCLWQLLCEHQIARLNCCTVAPPKTSADVYSFKDLWRNFRVNCCWLVKCFLYFLMGEGWNFCTVEVPLIKSNVFVLVAVLHGVTVCISTDNIMHPICGAIVCLSVLGAVKLLSLPLFWGLPVGLVLCMASRGFCQFIHVALRTIKRDLM